MNRRDALKAMAGLMAASTLDLPDLVRPDIQALTPKLPYENAELVFGHEHWDKLYVLVNGQEVLISWDGPESSDVSLVQVGGLENDPLVAYAPVVTKGVTDFRIDFVEPSEQAEASLFPHSEPSPLAMNR